MKKSEAAKVVAFLIAAFPSSKAGPETSAVYESMLAEVDSSLAWSVVRRLVATARFLPTVSEVLAALQDMQRGPRRPGGDAWGDVMRAISSTGAYRLPSFDDPVVADAVRAIGWRELCLSENQTADRARFIQLYDEFAGRKRQGEILASLPSPKPTGSLPPAASAPLLGSSEEP